MLIQLASFDDLHFDVDVLNTCPVKFKICFEENGRLGLGLVLTENFPELRDFHLISEIVLADNHLPKRVPTEVFSRGTPFGLNILPGRKFRQRRMNV